MSSPSSSLNRVLGAVSAFISSMAEARAAMRMPFFCLASPNWDLLFDAPVWSTSRDLDAMTMLPLALPMAMAARSSASGGFPKESPSSIESGSSESISGTVSPALVELPMAPLPFPA